MSELVLAVGLAHKLEGAFSRNDWTLTEVDKLCEGNILAQFREVLRGHATITVPEHIIDLDANPFIPDGWSVEEHQKGGQFTWDSAKVALYLSKEQQNGKWIKGNKLREELAKKVPFNANLLDYLLAHPHLIPEEWKGKLVFFWGTIYRDRRGRPCVRCLGWHGEGEDWYYDYWVGFDWNVYDPAAVPAS